MVTEDKFEPIENFKQSTLKNKKIVKKDGKQFIKTQIEKEVYGYKIFKE
jgi:hypothetical protein